MSSLRNSLVPLLLVILLVLTALALGCGSSATTTQTQEEEQTEQEAGPKTAANRFYRAINDLDAEKLAAVFDPDEIDDFEDVSGVPFETALENFFFGTGEALKFSSLKYDVDLDGDEATITIIKGKVSSMGGDGEIVTETLSRDDDIVLLIVKNHGKWYVSLDSFPDFLADATASNATPGTTNPQPSPQPAPSANYVTCRTCGGTGVINCLECQGQGGFYIGGDVICPDCAGGGVVACYWCDGTGVVEGGDGWYTCDVCGGNGNLYCDSCGGSGFLGESVWQDCPRCGGSGIEGCPDCDGSGWVRS